MNKQVGIVAPLCFVSLLDVSWRDTEKYGHAKKVKGGESFIKS